MRELLVARLTHRYEYVAGRADEVFVRQIQSYLEALDSERATRRILKALRQDAEAAVDRFNATERDLVAEAVSVRRRLAQAAPEVDNSNEPRPDIRSGAFGAWHLDSFASFDQLSEDRRRLEFAPLPYYAQNDDSPLAMMLIILAGRLRRAQYGDQGGLLSEENNLRPDLDDFHREINNVSAKHEVALRAFREDGLTLPGLADERLRLLTGALRPEPFVVAVGDDPEEVAERALVRGLEQLTVKGIFRNALDGVQLEAGERAVFQKAVQFLRGELERLHVEIADRLRRGEGEIRGGRALRFIGRGSRTLGLFILAGIVSAIIGLLVTAYVQDWLPGLDGSKPHPRTNAP